MQMNEHRQWLRENGIGMKFTISKDGKFSEGYKDKLYSEEFYDEEINQIQINPRLIVLEYDCERENAWAYAEKTKELLRKDKIYFEFYHHQGRSPHVHFYADGPLTKQQKEFLLKKYSVDESIDIALANPTHLIAVPYAKHWKYGAIKELIDKNDGLRLAVADIPKFIEKTETDENNKKRERILDILINHGKKIDKTFKLCCMFHDDKNPSMLLNQTNAYCFAESKIYSFDKIARYYGEELEEDQIKNLTPEIQSLILESIDPIFYDHAGLWWLWDIKILAWRKSDETDILNMVERKVKSPLNLINSKVKNEVLLLLRLHGRKNIPKEAPKSWIQFKNGIIDLNDFDAGLIKPSHEYFMTNPIPWEISNSEETPFIDKLFKEWVDPDFPQFVDTLYEIFAYCLYRDYPINRMFCLHGPGSNGKTTFLNMLRTFLGIDNYSSTRLSTLLNNRFELIVFHKKLMVTISETTFREIENSDVLKDLTGGDSIKFEYKYAIDSLNENNYAKLLISTNNLPPTSDKSQGYYRRWLIVDFPNVFPEKRDVLAEIPKEEYGNLARKCVLKLKELLIKREFSNEGTIEERQFRYEDRSNPIEKFLREFTIENYEGFIWKHDFEEKLNQWCKEKGVRAISTKTISQKMREHNIIEEKREAAWANKGIGGRIRCWAGISWKDESEKDNTEFISTFIDKDSKIEMINI